MGCFSNCLLVKYIMSKLPFHFLKSTFSSHLQTVTSCWGTRRVTAATPSSTARTAFVNWPASLGPRWCRRTAAVVFFTAPTPASTWPSRWRRPSRAERSTRPRSTSTKRMVRNQKTPEKSNVYVTLSLSNTENSRWWHNYPSCHLLLKWWNSILAGALWIFTLSVCSAFDLVFWVTLSCEIFRGEHCFRQSTWIM